MVTEWEKEQNKPLSLRLNSDDPNSPKELQLLDATSGEPGGSSGWIKDVDKDVAVHSVNVNYIEANYKADFFLPQHRANRAMLASLGVSAGDDISVLGFPMNLAGAQKNYVIVRNGSLARISDVLDGTSSNFLIDSLVFPGNSGGPVVLRPNLGAIGGTKPISSAYLFGMVISYVPYNDIAVSQQTKQPRVIFQENSGLAEVVPLDNVDALIQSWEAKSPALLPPPVAPSANQALHTP